MPVNNTFKYYNSGPLPRSTACHPRWMRPPLTCMPPGGCHLCTFSPSRIQALHVLYLRDGNEDKKYQFARDPPASWCGMGSLGKKVRSAAEAHLWTLQPDTWSAIVVSLCAEVDLIVSPLDLHPYIPTYHSPEPGASTFRLAGGVYTVPLRRSCFGKPNRSPESPTIPCAGPLCLRMPPVTASLSRVGPWHVAQPRSATYAESATALTVMV